MSKKPKPSITCAKNGPYIVKDLNIFTNSYTETITTKETMALCRCGASNTKPFCDGTHAKIGFKDNKEEDRVPDKRDNYVGKEITIHDNRGICSHAGFCTDCLPSVWRMKQEPWIDPDGDEVHNVIDTIRMCPSGALSYSINGKEHRDQDRLAAIHVSKDGPYYITGKVDLKDVQWLEGTSKEHYTLCRCGGSKNKPFCDGSHWYIKFKDDEKLTHKGTEDKQSSDNKESTDDKVAQSNWHKVADKDEIKDGEVKAVTAGSKTIALSLNKGTYGALDNACPHQGGPLGDGSMEEECLRCPWHGWEFDPVTGIAADPNNANATKYDIEVREDGIYVAVKEVATPTKTVSDVMVETMVNWGIKNVFGMVGHSNLGLADAIRRQEEKGSLIYIGIRHEGAAAFACSAYAKLTGKPAACLTIAGPGATNLLTGLWDAHVDRAPVLALTGQVNTQVLGPGAFQEIDQASAFEAVSTWSQTVLSTSNHPELMSLALKHAIVKRSVSHLIFPDEVQVQPADDEHVAADYLGRLSEIEITPAREAIQKALEKIAGAKRPIIIVGHGARYAMKPILELAEKITAPVLTTFKAKGQIPDDHPLAASVLGRSGTPIASSFMNESDLIIVFGASFANHTGIDATKPTIQVDFDRMALAKFHAVEIPIWGEIGTTAELLKDQLPKQINSENCQPEIAKRWANWRQEKETRMAKDRGKGINSAIIFAALTKQAPENAVITVDVGNNTYSFGRYFECKNQTILMSGYLGSIGFGFPAAMGAWAGAPNRPIICVCGDGGFGQYLAEFTTAVKYNMNITVILLNNNELGKISKEQRDSQWQVWQTSLKNPNFANYAKNCGGFGIQVSQASELNKAINEALNHNGPALVEILSDAELI